MAASRQGDLGQPQELCDLPQAVITLMRDRKAVVRSRAYSG